MNSDKKKGDIIDEEDTQTGCSGLTFEDCQLNILRDAMDEAEKNLSKKVAQSPVVRNIFKIIEKFIASHKMMIYGGTAINNILPPKLKFYNTDIDVPDYDVFSPNAIEDVKEMCDIFYENGYKNVEAKTANHVGTYKVYVNYLPVLDVTQMDGRLLDTLLKEGIKKNGLYYSPVNLLRFSMYAELSRPQSQPSRWEKVFKRLVTLNKAYPFHYDKCSKSNLSKKNKKIKGLNKPDFLVIRNGLIEKGVIFIGGYANTLFSSYLKNVKKTFDNITHFDVLSPNPKEVAKYIKDQLEFVGHTGVSMIKRGPYDELIPSSYVIKINNTVVCVIYKTMHCYAYNKLEINGHQVNIASIDTLLHFYLAFYYATNTKYSPFYNPDKLLCMSEFLFEIQEHNMLSQRGLLKRFVTDCEGHEETREEIRQHLNLKYNELKGDKGSKEYEKYFLKYYPGNNVKRKTTSKRMPSDNKVDGDGDGDGNGEFDNSDSDSDESDGDESDGDESDSDESDGDESDGDESESDSDKSESDSDSDKYAIDKGANKDGDGDDNVKSKSQIISQLNDNIVEYSKRKTLPRKSLTVTKKKQSNKIKKGKLVNNNFFQLF